MAAPDRLMLERNRDLAGRERRPLARWILLALLGLFLLAGLLNVFGQRPSTDVVQSADARLSVDSPARLRSGLLFETRVRVDARRELRDATLVLDPGWLEGMTLNTVAPEPLAEASRDGRIALRLGHVPKGDEHVVFLQFQVNPTNVGRRAADVDLLDGDRLLLHLDRTVTVWP